MIEFLSPSLEDVFRLQSIARENTSVCCETAPACLYLWQERYPTAWHWFRSAVVMRFLDYYFFPRGWKTDEECRSIILQLWENAKEEKKPFCFCGVTRNEFYLLDRLFPQTFQYQLDLDDSDYVYSAEDLISLRGRKYQAKRNHVSRFIRSFPSFSYQEISENNLELCRSAAYRWYREEGHEEASFLQEYHAICVALEHYSDFGMKGGILTVDDELAAFTLGEPISEDVFDIHFEKAFSQYDGAYAMINQAFAQNSLSSYQYINREEDLGVPGLRKAKQSYHPAYLLEKGTVTLNTEEI